MNKFVSLASSANKVLLTIIVAVLLVLFFNIFQVFLRMQEGVQQNNQQNELPLLTSQFSYLVDKHSSWTVDDVLSDEKTFTDVAADKIPYEMGTQSYWIKLVVDNNDEQNRALVLHADNPMLAAFDGYRVAIANDNAAGHAVEKIFSLADLDESQLNPRVFPHISMTIAPHSQYTVLLRLQTLGPPNIPLVLYSKPAFEQRIQFTEVIFGAFIGIVLLMAVYNLVLYFAIRDKVYLVYIGYLLTSFLVLSSLNGFGYFLFSTAWYLIFAKNVLFFDYFIVIFLMLFTLFFLRYDTSKNISYRLGIAFCLALFLIAFGSFLLNEVQKTLLFFSIQPLVYVFAITIVIRRLKADFHWARFYFISWIPLLIGAAVQPMMSLNHLEYSFLARNAFLLGVLAEISFMAFALAERMRRNEQDRLRDLSYHGATQLPRKLALENVINELIERSVDKFSVLVIKPQQIDRIALYVDDDMKVTLFKRLSNHLASLLMHNDAVLELGKNHDKLCFLENNSLAILVHHKKNQQPMQVMIDSIQTFVKEAYQVDQLSLPLTGLIGVANYPEHGRQSHLLINRAQLAVQKAELTDLKWQYFQAPVMADEKYLLTLATEIQTSLKNGDFEIYHQPQIDLKTSRVCGSECLVRWRHPREGLLAPEIFIPVAEDMGLMNQLSQWIIARSLQQHQQIIDSGFKNHMVSINISGKDIVDEHFYHHVVTIFDQFGVRPEKVVFELAESAVTNNSPLALVMIEKLDNLGVTVSIDHFGRGFSSLAHISQLPVKELKVDRQFVENVCDDIKRRTIAKTTVKMGKGIGLEVVADGINSQLDEDTFRAFGCDIGQGFYYAEPMPLAEYLVWLNDQVNGHLPHPDEKIHYGEFIAKEIIAKDTITKDRGER